MVVAAIAFSLFALKLGQLLEEFLNQVFQVLDFLSVLLSQFINALEFESQVHISVQLLIVRLLVEVLDRLMPAHLDSFFIDWSKYSLIYHSQFGERIYLLFESDSNWLLNLEKLNGLELVSQLRNATFSFFSFMIKFFFYFIEVIKLRKDTFFLLEFLVVSEVLIMID